jgi:hypothetical protein
VRWKCETRISECGTRTKHAAVHSAFRIRHSALESWLPGVESHHHERLQRARDCCYPTRQEVRLHGQWAIANRRDGSGAVFLGCWRSAIALKVLVEPEVVATSPCPVKSRVPVCCGFDSEGVTGANAGDKRRRPSAADLALVTRHSSHPKMAEGRGLAPHPARDARCSTPARRAGPVDLPKWCRVKDSHPQPSRSERDASAVGLTRHGKVTGDLWQVTRAVGSTCHLSLVTCHTEVVLPAGLSPASPTFEASRSGN